jgi:hypothetical protein
MKNIDKIVKGTIDIVVCSFGDLHMRDYFLTQRKLGSLFLMSVLTQVAWWGAVMYVHRDNIDLLAIYDTWISAPMLGKILGGVFFVAIPAAYLYTLFGLGFASWKLLTMSDYDFAILRALQRVGWKTSTFFGLVAPIMIAMTLVLFGVALEGAPGSPESAGVIFGLLCFVLSFGSTGLPLAQFQSAEYRRKTSNIDNMVVFS